jgi:hypothetical protein
MGAPFLKKFTDKPRKRAKEVLKEMADKIDK